MTLWPKGQPQESFSAKGVTINVVRNKQQLRTGLCGIDKADKRPGLKKEATWSTTEMVFGKKSWWKTGLAIPFGGKNGGVAAYSNVADGFAGRCNSWLWSYEASDKPIRRMCVGCNHGLEHCVLGCNDRAWKWSDGQIMECEKQCDQRKAECEQLCSKLKERATESVTEYCYQGLSMDGHAAMVSSQAR